VRGNFLDVHAALARCHQADALCGAVDHHPDVELLADVGTLFDQQPAHLLAFWAGLVRDELHAEDARCVRLHLVERTCQLDATALAAPPGMDLRLDDPHRAAQRPGCRHRLVDRQTRHAARDRHAVLLEDFLALVLVDLHRDSPCSVLEWTSVVAGAAPRNQRG
jgi:hypothetical protein